MKDLIQFCNKVTPTNWHVTTDRRRFVFQGPGSLNIWVRIVDQFIDGWFYAFKKGHMKFYLVSHYADRHPNARKSYQQSGDYRVAESEIWLYPDGCRFFGDNLYAAALHELAHVAVDRCFAYTRKSHRHSGRTPAITADQRHGKVFCRFFEALIARATTTRDIGCGGIHDALRSELNCYRNGGKTSAP